MPPEQAQKLKEDLSKKEALDKKVKEQQDQIVELGKKIKEATSKIKEMSKSTPTNQDADQAEKEAEENINDLDDGSEDASGFPWAVLVGAAAVAAQLLG